MGFELPADRQAEAMRNSGWLLLAASAIQIYGTFSSTWVTVSYFVFTVIEVVWNYGLVLMSYQIGTVEDSGVYKCETPGDTACTECKNIGFLSWCMLLVSIIFSLWAGKIFRLRVKDNTQAGQRQKAMNLLGVASILQALLWFMFTSGCGDKVTEYVTGLAAASGGTTTASDATIGLAGILNLIALILMCLAQVANIGTPEGASLGGAAVVPAPEG